MRLGIVNGWPGGKYRQGAVIIAEPTNRQMRRLAAKQAKERAPGSAQSKVITDTKLTKGL